MNTYPLETEKLAPEDRIFVRSAFNYDNDMVSEQTGLSCPEETLTQQNTAEETDINFIVATFTRTGILPNAQIPPTYGDFSGVSDYREALELIQEADNAFNSLPAPVRAHFGNNPASYLDFIENGSDLDLAAKLGIIDNMPNLKPDETDLSSSS